MWIVLAVLVAVLTSLQDIINKQLTIRINIFVVCWAWWFFSLPFLAALLPFKSMPELSPRFWAACFWAAFFVVIATVLYVKALKYSDLSLSVPMLNVTPLLLLFTSPIMLKEFPKPLGIAGVLLIVAGSYLLNIKDRAKGWLAPFQSLLLNKGSRYMLMIGIIFGISANLDKVGVVESSPVVWMVILGIAISAGLTVIMVLRCPDYIDQIKLNGRALLFIGFLNGATLLIQMYAITMTQVPYLIAVKRTSALMSAGFGFMFLKERGFRERMMGILLMVLGVFMISFS